MRWYPTLSASVSTIGPSNGYYTFGEMERSIDACTNSVEDFFEFAQSKIVHYQDFVNNTSKHLTHPAIKDEALLGKFFHITMKNNPHKYRLGLKTEDVTDRSNLYLAIDEIKARKYTIEQIEHCMAWDTAEFNNWWMGNSFGSKTMGPIDRESMFPKADDAIHVGRYFFFPSREAMMMFKLARSETFRVFDMAGQIREASKIIFEKTGRTA